MVHTIGVVEVPVHNLLPVQTIVVVEVVRTMGQGLLPGAVMQSMPVVMVILIVMVGLEVQIPAVEVVEGIVVVVEVAQVAPELR
jgi:hypothetical protein